MTAAGPAHTPLIPGLEELCALLARVNGVRPSSREKTFFSLGRRGHWENPASDVLAFFLDPREEHGFGPLFLRVFLGCMAVDAGGLDLESAVHVNVEETLPSGERIDLMVRAPGWVMAVENKIFHWAANDFKAYAAHVRRGAGEGRPVHLALLAPEPDRTKEGWTPVSYRALCEGLHAAFEEGFPVSSPTKWQVFAREFVAHLHNLLYPVPMKLETEQVALVEEHFAQIETLKQYSKSYDSFLQDELRARLGQVLPRHQPFEFGVQHWALVCDGPGGSGWRLAFLTPAHAHGGNPHRKFIAAVHLARNAGEALHQRAERELAVGFIRVQGWRETAHDSREAAVGSLCEMALRLFGDEVF